MAEFFYLDLHIVDESNSLYEVFAHDHFYFQTEEIDMSASAHSIRQVQVISCHFSLMFEEPVNHMTRAVEESYLSHKKDNVCFTGILNPMRFTVMGSITLL